MRRTAPGFGVSQARVNGRRSGVASGSRHAYYGRSETRTWGRSGSTEVKKRTLRAGGVTHLVKTGSTAITAEDNYALAA